MKQRKCPQAKGKMCWSYGDCDDCSFSIMIQRYERKITRLKAENAKLAKEADDNAALAMEQKLRADRLESGEMVGLPCKVGDTVWLLNDPYYVADICEVVIEDIKISRNGMTVNCIYDNDYCEFKADYIFKSKEKAEARLKELREKGNKNYE